MFFRPHLALRVGLIVITKPEKRHQPDPHCLWKF